MADAAVPWREVSTPSSGGTMLRVRLTPKSSREGVDGVAEGRLLVRVSPPPAEGRANRALVKLLARELGVPPSRIEVVKGGASRLKAVFVKEWAPP